MRRLPWLFLLGLFFAGCGRTEPKRGECCEELKALQKAQALKKAEVVDLTNGPRTIAAGFTGDQIVNVSEPSTVYVVQNYQVLFAAHWRHSRAGSVTVPLDSVADTTRPATIGVWPGRIDEHPAWNWGVAPNCVDCVKTAMHKCCMIRLDR